MKRIVKSVGFFLMTVFLGMWIKDPVINFIRVKSSGIPFLRRITDFSMVRIEPNVIHFNSQVDYLQKSFRLINDSVRPIYRFRAYMSSRNLSIEDVDIFLSPKNQVAANDFDEQKDVVCSVFSIKTNDGKQGKLVNIYKIPEQTKVDFYIKAKGGTVVKFDPVEWDPEESGIVLFDKGGTETPIFFTSNLGNGGGKIKKSGMIQGMKVMLLQY